MNVRFYELRAVSFNRTRNISDDFQLLGQLARAFLDVVTGVCQDAMC